MLTPHEALRLAVAAAASAVLGGGCAATPRRTAASPGVTRIEMEPMKLEVVRSPAGPAKIDAYDAASLFEQAGADLQAQRWDAAITGYDRLLAGFPDSRYVPAALYNSGLAFEGKKDFAGAAARYRRIVDKERAGKDALDALFRMGSCYAEVSNWAASADAFAQVLDHQGLSLDDRMEAQARRGLAQYQMKDAGAAERTFRDAIAYYRHNESIERLENDFFLALSQFYLGELAHDQFRAAPLRLPQKQLEKDLNAKAEMLLQTQARYVDVARIRNPAWATAAGYQMATLYKEFYDSLVAAPIPPELPDDAKKIYQEELRRQIEPLLRKAIHAHELTRGVAERNGIDNEWVRKSSDQLEQLRALLDPGAASAPTASSPLGAPPPEVAPRDHGRGPGAPRPGRPENEKRETPPRSAPASDYHPRVIL